MEIGLVSNDLDIMKIHLVVVFVDMAGDLGVMIEIRNCSFVFGNPGFQRSLCLAVVYKITVVAANFVYSVRCWAVNIILCLWKWKQTVHSLQRFVSDFDPFLSQDAANPFRSVVDIRKYHEAIRWYIGWSF